MRVVITGASGFIGNNLVRALAGDHSILAFVRPSSNFSEFLHNENIEVARCDLRDKSAVFDSLVKFQPEVAIHLAWDGIPDFSLGKCIENISVSTSFIDLVISLPSCSRILVSGSCREYGFKDSVCSETDASVSVDNLSWAKNTIRDYLKFRADEASIEYAWIRLFYVYGPCQRPESLLPAVLSSLRETRSLPNLSNAFAWHDYVHVSDVVEFLRRTIDVTEFKSGIYNVGSGKLTCVATICNLALTNFSKLCTSPLKIKPIDVAGPKEGAVACVERSSEVFGWRSKILIEKGISEIVNQYYDGISHQKKKTAD